MNAFQRTNLICDVICAKELQPLDQLDKDILKAAIFGQMQDAETFAVEEFKRALPKKSLPDSQMAFKNFKRP